jgi:hypothetical protein
MDNSRNYIDLMYLTNPSNISKIQKIKENKNTNVKEKKRLKSEIMKMTERLINGEQISCDIDALFNQYFIKIRNHLKFIKKKNIVQSQYHLMGEKEKKEYIKMDISTLDISIMKKPKKVKQISDFVKKTKRKKKKVIMPKKIIFE